MSVDLRVVRAEGDAGQRGRTVGKAFRDLIENSIDFNHEYMEARGVSSPDLQELLTPHLVAAESATPELMSLVAGMAEGAMVPVMELFAINAFEELEPLLAPVGGHTLFLEHKEGRTPQATATTAPNKVERCSAFTVAGEDFTLLGHNEQWLAGDYGNVGVVIEMPAGQGETALASPVSVCCLPSVGMNEHGEAQGIESLTASDDRVGVPRVFESRHVLESRDRDDAIRRAGLEQRAGGYGHTLAFRGGDALTVETTATKLRVTGGTGTHTNHYLDQELAAMAPEPSPDSLSRYNRMNQLIAERRPDTPEAVMEILRDHDSSPAAICLHPDPADGDEAESVVFSMVCDLEAGRMWVAPGLPCQNDYEEIDLAGVR